jgi:Zn-dependent protease with chaperone function
MFGNFIQYIVVLLIYATYQPVTKTNFSLAESLFLFFCMALVFASQVWLSFLNLEKRIPEEPIASLDLRFHNLILRQSILAIGLFAINIYGLNLTSFLAILPLFSRIPTLQALFCLAIFIGYLAIIWACGHSAYRQIYPTHLSRAAYVSGNIALGVPVLLPWLVLSIAADLLLLLPFDSTRWILSSMPGQIGFFLFFLFGIALTGPSLIRRFWRCTPVAHHPYRQRIEALCHRARMDYRDILFWPLFGGRMITAGVMGLVARFRYILVTKALLYYLAPEELDAVVAHEIGHVKKHHLLFYLMFFAGFMLLALALQNVFVYFFLYARPVYRFLAGFGLSPETIKSALDALVFITLFVIYFRYIFGFFMRNFERQADAFVYTHFESAAPLVSTLKKIALASGQPMEKPNWHHFGIGQRIGFLEKCEADRAQITRHDRKLRISMAVYGVGMVLLAVIGYQLNYGQGGQTFFRHQLIRHFKQELAASASNPLVLTYLGDLYYEDGDLEKAALAYEQALAIKERNPYVLNNLAWLYATGKDPNLRYPQRALFLARKAAELDPSAHVLDTLAECFFVNGDVASAISTETLALKAAKKNQAGYRKQLSRFKAEANRQD